MDPIQKNFEIKILDKRPDGGRIVISTSDVDRSRDRVFPQGAQIDNYLKNAVVQWSHNYRDAWSTIGRTTNLIKSSDGLVADFELRPAANDQDPQNIIRLLWEGDWIKTASIGFIPLESRPNNLGGMDFTSYELLEWSLTPVPANPSALALAFNKSIDPTALENYLLLTKADATLEDQTAPLPRAWVRKLTAQTGQGEQTVLASFYTYTIAVPEDATVLQMDSTLDECNEVKHPDAGKTVEFKTMLMVPPLDIIDLATGQANSVVARNGRTQPDEQMLGESEYWHDVTLSPIIDSLPAREAKDVTPLLLGLPIDILTTRSLQRADRIIKRLHNIRIKQPDQVVVNPFDQALADLMLAPGYSTVERDRIEEHLLRLRSELGGPTADISSEIDGREVLVPETKAGRVLSKKNENKIRSARDNLNEVLAEVETQPEENAAKADLIDVTIVNENVLSMPCPHCDALNVIWSYGPYTCIECSGTFAALTDHATEDGPTRSIGPWDMSNVGLYPVEAKAAIPPHTSPMCDPGMAWDGPAQVAACASTPAALRKMHAWVDSNADPAAKSSYKLPHHMAADGKVNLRGVNNAKARLANTNIPAGDKPGVDKHLQTHQDQFSKSKTLRDYARALVEVANEMDTQNAGDDFEEVEGLQNLLRDLQKLTRTFLHEA